MADTSKGTSKLISQYQIDFKGGGAVRNMSNIEESKYEHPKGCSDYLDQTVVPILTEGLHELLREIQKDRVRLAGGAAEDIDGFLKSDWKPFSPLRWLAEWLRSHNPQHQVNLPREQAEAVVLAPPPTSTDLRSA